MKKYVGITIGPIYDTILEASTPAALWFASSLFSDVTKRICQAVKNEAAFGEVHLLSPYHAEDIRENDGVGKYHDRIFFSVTNFDEQRLKDILHNVKKDTNQNFPEDVLKGAEDFFEKYIQIHYVIMDDSEIGENGPILTMSPYLDLLELMKTFPKENTVNPVRKLFLGKGESANQYIKECKMFRDIQNSQFITKDQNGKTKIWSIEEIASDHGKSQTGLKKDKYYAMVQADGDGVGKFLNSLSKDDAKITEFSHHCLQYDECAADMIGEFGGMTIYAGGDDLLFLAPVVNSNGETIFSLCHRIAKMFEEKVKGGPTVSFGISIQYKKFPLYEAHKSSGDLLYQVKNHIKEKNSMAVNLQKHSGQSMGFVVSNEDYSILEKLLAVGSDIQNPEEKVTSVIQTLETFRRLIEVMNCSERTKNNKESYLKAFMNLFDNPKQGAAKQYLEEICSHYYDHFIAGNTSIDVLPDEKKKKQDHAEKIEKQAEDFSLTTLLYILRLKKFLCEKGDES